MGRKSREKRIKKMLPEILREIGPETKVYRRPCEECHLISHCPYHDSPKDCPYKVEDPELTRKWQEVIARQIAEERLRTGHG